MGALRYIGKFLLVCGCLPLVQAGGAVPAWYVVHGEYFDLYTDSGRREAVDAAVWIDQFRRTVGGVWKVGPQDISRATIVQFRSEREFRPYGFGRYNAGFFMRSEALSTMVYHRSGDEDVVRNLVQHEAVHWLLASKRARLPTWVNEGLAEVFATFSLEGNTCRMYAGDVANVRWLQSNGIKSLDAVIAYESEDLDYTDPEQIRYFYAQAWALTHYLLAGRNARAGSEQLARFVEIVNAGVPARDAFEQAFGMTFEEMRRELERYAHTGSYTMIQAKIPRGELESQFTAEPATEVEVQCALAGALIAGSRRYDQAESMMRRARETWPDSPLPYERLGAAAYFRGDYRAAAEMFGGAAERGSRHPCAYYLPASDELRDRLGFNPTRRELRPVDARRLSDSLRKALELDRNLPQAAYFLGQALLFTDPLVKADVQFLAQVETHADDPLVVRYRLAGLLWRLGDARARTILEMLSKTRDNERLREAALADLAILDGGSSDVVIGARYVLKPAESRATLSVPIRRPGR